MSVAPLHCLYQELHISNFALVDSAVVHFLPGLNVVSGQSGAGKSVLLDALQQLMGAAAAADCVRPPAELAVIEGSWCLAAPEALAAAELLTELGLPPRALPAAAAATGAADMHSEHAAAAAASQCQLLHIRREVSKQHHPCGSIISLQC